MSVPLGRYRTYESSGDLDYYMIFGPEIRCGRATGQKIGERQSAVGVDR